MTSASEIVRIKIRLDGVKPTVMRRIEVPVNVTLDTLHEMIQAIMPWGNYHGYEFHVRESRWGIPMPDFDFGYPVADARKATLALALSEPNLRPCATPMISVTIGGIQSWSSGVFRPSYGTSSRG